jgi:hypothetical protein
LAAQDSLREYIFKAIEAYDVAATPPLSNIYNLGVDPDEYPSDPRDNPIATSRERRLEVGIDVKYLLINFTNSIIMDHGTRRAQRFTRWIKDGGYAIWQYSHAHRQELRADIKRFIRIVNRYKRVNTHSETT